MNTDIVSMTISFVLISMYIIKLKCADFKMIIKIKTLINH